MQLKTFEECIAEEGYVRTEDELNHHIQELIKISMECAKKYQFKPESDADDTDWVAFKDDNPAGEFYISLISILNIKLIDKMRLNKFTTECTKKINDYLADHDLPGTAAHSFHSGYKLSMMRWDKIGLNNLGFKSSKIRFAKASDY